MSQLYLSYVQHLSIEHNMWATPPGTSWTEWLNTYPKAPWYWNIMRKEAIKKIKDRLKNSVVPACRFGSSPCNNKCRHISNCWTMENLDSMLFCMVLIPQEQLECCSSKLVASWPSIRVTYLLLMLSFCGFVKKWMKFMEPKRLLQIFTCTVI